MALVHDLAESLVGDLLPNEVTKDEKYRREKVSMWNLPFVNHVAITLHVQAAMDHIKTLVPEKVSKMSLGSDRQLYRCAAYAYAIWYCACAVATLHRRALSVRVRASYNMIMHQYETIQYAES